MAALPDAASATALRGSPEYLLLRSAEASESAAARDAILARGRCWPTAGYGGGGPATGVGTEPAGLATARHLASGGAVVRIVAARDGRVVMTAAGAGGVAVVSLPTGAGSSLVAHGGSPLDAHCVAELADGSGRLLCGGDGLVYLYDVSAAAGSEPVAPTRTYECGSLAVTAVAAVGPGHFVSGSKTDGVVTAWEVVSGACVGRRVFDRLVSECLVALDEATVVVGCRRALHDVAVHRQLADDRAGSEEGLALPMRLRALARLRDGCVATAHDDGVRLWNMHVRTCVGKLAGPARPTYSLVQLGDGRLIGNTAVGLFYVWEPATHEYVGAIATGDGVSCAAVAADGRLVIPGVPTGAVLLAFGWWRRNAAVTAWALCGRR